VNGRVLAVTGAFGALGRALCRMASQRGARIAALGRGAAPSPPDLEAEVVLGGVDLADPAAAQRAMDAAAARLGGIDALANVAGGFRWEKIEAGDPDLWERMFTINLKTAAFASRAALAHLARSASGRIVNVGANAALKANAGMGPYAASKAAVHKLTESLADELKGTAINVNAVLPTILDTEANRRDMPDADFSAWVKPEDLAAVILFLASPEARAVNGALIPVAGRL
jgi:NAD(P)-dependent dehydrogenase (short-subunit alcohol dehydrogenase family)